MILIELLVGVVLIAALSVLVLISWFGELAKTRDAGRLADMTAFRQTMELVNAEHGNYAGAAGGCLSGNILSMACDAAGIRQYFLKAELNDPIGGASCCDADLSVCKNDNCEYCFEGYSSEKKNYSVYFHVEKGSTGLFAPGCYKLTSGGVEFVGAGE